MKRSLYLRYLCGIGSTVVLIGCTTPSPSASPQVADSASRPASVTATATVTESKTLKLARSLFKELPQADAVPKELSDLGRMLYYDKRLSRSGTVSCNSCHSLKDYGVDNKSTSPGDKGQLGGRNSPTVYNAYLHIAQFWDGRAKDVEEQAGGPMLNPVEMALPDAAAATKVLKSIADYQKPFAQAFPGQKDPVSFENAAKAIGGFERGLLTPSRFDHYLAGDESALSSAEQQGLETFVQVGCASCHAGALIGGDRYQKVGVKTPYPTKDKGRSAVTGSAADDFVFKVPSLRNITKTGPYFHDGSVASLDEAIKRMGHYQLGTELKPEEIQSIAAFLGSLEGQIPEDYIREPEISSSGNK